MAEEYSRELLRRAVAQVCQLLGWHAMHSSPLAVLTHVLEKYLVALASSAHGYAEHDCRTDPTLDDLACAFRDLNVRLPELRAYARAVPPSPLPHPTPTYPLPKASTLNFLKPGSREVVTRPAHVHDHLPPMWPDREQEDGDPNSDPTKPDPDADPFKRPGEPAPPAASLKRNKIKQDDECHARELSSVMMTVSGYLSPAREGKLPEARTPITLPDVPPEKAKLQYNPLAARPPVPLNDRLDKKLKKKAVNGKIEKSKKKDKPQKVPLDKPYNPNENRPNKLTPHVAKTKQPSKNHANKPPGLNNLFFPDEIKVIKQEVIDKPVKAALMPVEHKLPKAPLLQTPPPINAHKPVVPKPTPIVNSQLKSIPDLPLNITIKEEKLDTEKLTLQPDRSKLNIFKKISTKIKEEKPNDSFNDKNANDCITISKIKVEKTSPPCSSPYRPEELFSKQKIVNEFKPSISANTAVDLTSKRNHSEVINIDDDIIDVTKQVIKQEPLDDYPKDLSRPKISVTPHSVLAAPIIKEKKERKRKERKIKVDKVAKEYTKLIKKQLTDIAKNVNETGESSLTHTSLPPGFPFFPASPGLIPGLIPNPSFMPTGPLFPNLPNKHAFRSMMASDASHMLPNPFSLKEAPTNLFLPTPSGFPQNLSHPLLVNHGFGQPPRMPQPLNLPTCLRRPSLEVIPIDADDDNKIKHKPHFISPALVIKEKEKPKNSKLSINNSFLSNSVDVSITTTIKQSSPKTNPIIPIPLIKPDVTIKLNTSPPEKLKPVEMPKKVVEVQPFTVKEKEKEKSEKKKDKLHKKDKKDKEQRIKKKKDKKEKLKIKIEKKREKMELKEKLKKDKKEKKKEKEKPLTLAEGLVPKLTLKLGPPSPMPPSPDTTKRLNIKPIVKKEDEAQSPVHVPQTSDIKMQVEGNQSPELAKISALVTRPPKPKSSSKHNTSVKGDTSMEMNSANSPPMQQSNVSPVRKTKPPSSYAKYKRIHFKPIPKRNSSDFDDPIIDLASEDIEMKETPPQPSPPPPEKMPNVPLGTPYYTDPQGNKVWICPACGRPDNGTPMIACDGCDGWYHWICVGIHVEPANSEDWYCTSCSAKRTAMASAMAGGGQTAKKRGRKPKMDKLKEIR
ncbi:uncharacterized protein LOC143911836 [Arctopsyche grandis]|uniref:uncharacterized protein LOC143911836 n=1 Tax=Arctopsyche grandis TaxID=121162 RepID=UPI00406D8FCB